MVNCQHTHSRWRTRKGSQRLLNSFRETHFIFPTELSPANLYYNLQESIFSARSRIGPHWFSYLILQENDIWQEKTPQHWGDVPEVRCQHRLGQEHRKWKPNSTNRCLAIHFSTSLLKHVRTLYICVLTDTSHVHIWLFQIHVFWTQSWKFFNSELSLQRLGVGRRWRKMAIVLLSKPFNFLSTENQNRENMYLNF